MFNKAMFIWTKYSENSDSEIIYLLQIKKNILHFKM